MGKLPKFNLIRLGDARRRTQGQDGMGVELVTFRREPA